jgi:putative FmdB family regulatory protein
VPIYEYTCKSCEERFEKLVRSMNGQEKVACPKCRSVKTVRSMSVFAVNSAAGGKPAAVAAPPGMCGRCGGPGPCGMGG